MGLDALGLGFCPLGMGRRTTDGNGIYFLALLKTLKRKAKTTIFLRKCSFLVKNSRFIIQQTGKLLHLSVK